MIYLFSKNTFNDFLRDKYNHFEYFELYNFQDFGKCYVKIIQYKCKNEHAPYLQQFYKFEIFPFNKKTRIYKYIITIHDVRRIVKNKFMYNKLLNVQGKGLINIMNQTVLNQFKF